MLNLMFSFLFILTVNSALADVCDTSGAPLCPESGAPMLDDRYPSRAFVISNMPFDPQFEAANRLPSRALAESMRAYDFNITQMPFMIFPGDADAFGQLKTNLIEELVRLGRTPADAEALVSARLRHSNGSPWTWQQDYQTTRYDRRTGQPSLHYLEIYESRVPRDTPVSLRSSVQASGNNLVCGLTAGEEIESSQLDLTKEDYDRSFEERGVYLNGGGEFGGNIEGLPGGLCLIGNNVTDDFAARVCGGAENVVMADSAWLSVGHVDEAFKVVPDHTSGKPAECAFKILSADTDLGFSLFERPENLNRGGISLPLAELRQMASESGAFETFASTDLFTGPLNGPGGQVLCDAARGIPEGRPRNAPGSRVDQAFLNFFMAKAWAQEIPSYDREAYQCVTNLDDIRGSDLRDTLRNIPGLREYNSVIQRRIMASRQLMYDKILARLPQCRQHFPDVASMFTPVPNIFSPDDPAEAQSKLITVNGRQEIRAEQGVGAHSLFPNPTNGVLMNRTLMFPGPQPDAYKSYLDQTIGQLGLRRSYLDTWSYAHVGQGNLHCVSQTIPYCRPRGAR